MAALASPREGQVTIGKRCDCKQREGPHKRELSNSEWCVDCKSNADWADKRMNRELPNH